ncbi:MAG TPA: PEGA domain-containing protein [Polyangiaceae bacterium]|nr:PEGA domain-containing protein [Polyangiaceae bacterium]
MRKQALRAFVLVLALPLAARADEGDTKRAEAIFNVGAQAYAQGEFKGAIEAFEEAYRISQRPGLLFSIAQAHRKQFYAMHDPADLRAATEHYRAYVAKVSSGKYRGIAVDELAELEGVTAKLGLSTQQAAEASAEKPRTRVMVSSAVDGARVALDNGPLHPSPLIADVTAGPHSVRVEADGYFEDRHPLVAVEGGLVALEVPLREKPAELVVHAESGADVLVDRRPVGRTPLAGPIELPAGTHFIALVRNGRRPYGEQMKLARGESKTLDVALAGTQQRVLSYVLLGGAATAVVLGGVFIGVAFWEQGQAESTLATSATRNITQSQLDAYSSAVSVREGFKLAAYGAFGGAVALALGAGALFFFDTPPAPLGPARFEEQGPRKPTTAPLEVSGAPLVGPGLVGASLVGRF